MGFRLIKYHFLGWVFASLTLLAGCAQDQTETVTVAVATNFKPALEELEIAFEAAKGHELTLVTGSTGKLYAQIKHGAPFDVFLSADQARPARLVEEGLAVKEGAFTYAIGQLALWSPTESEVSPERLQTGNFRYLAIANPELAPYGASAIDLLAALGVEERLSDKLVLGENIGQAFAFVQTGNADFGLIAVSQLQALPEKSTRQSWVPPIDLYAQIQQDAVLLERAVDNPAARAFIDFLKSEEAETIIEKAGYLTP